MSTQDEALLEHFLSVVAGAGGEYGPDAAMELRRMVARLRRDGLSFTGLIGWLIRSEAASRGFR